MGRDSPRALSDTSRIATMERVDPKQFDPDSGKAQKPYSDVSPAEHPALQNRPVIRAVQACRIVLSCKPATNANSAAMRNDTSPDVLVRCCSTPALSPCKVADIFSGNPIHDVEIKPAQTTALIAATAKTTTETLLRLCFCATIEPSRMPRGAEWIRSISERSSVSHVGVTYLCTEVKRNQ